MTVAHFVLGAVILLAAYLLAAPFLAIEDDIIQHKGHII